MGDCSQQTPQRRLFWHRERFKRSTQ
jgi:hypothetical protein